MFVYPDYTRIEAYISGTWEDITSYVLGDITAQYGMTSTSEDDRVSSLGLMFLTLNNSQGTFNPDGNGSPLSGFTKGTPVRVRVSFNFSFR